MIKKNFRLLVRYYLMFINQLFIKLFLPFLGGGGGGGGRGWERRGEGEGFDAPPVSRIKAVKGQDTVTNAIYSGRRLMGSRLMGSIG
jgi:hypothetical protein